MLCLGQMNMLEISLGYNGVMFRSNGIYNVTAEAMNKQSGIRFNQQQGLELSKRSSTTLSEVV